MKNNIINNKIKQMIPTFIIALVVPFMMFIYEPIVVYSATTEDF